MASQLGSFFRDQDLSVHSNGASLVGKGGGLKTQRKVGLGGRKPLGDLSNSGKPAALIQALQKQPSKEIIRDDSSNKKGLSKVSDTVQTRSRTALIDISNRQNEQGQKKKHNIKQVSDVAEGHLCFNDVSGEGFLHNHEECIKEQTKSMDMGSSKKLSFQSAPPLPRKDDPESPPREWDLEEMSEYDFPWLSDKLDSPPRCKSPKSLNCNADSLLIWDDCDFKLMETP
ncbi:uncharacterized protein [Pyrus communis]|uniref:uncharacterized protein isoform X2 n=1 Tax=Pyrus communis TaxID=23211 RepID=UPI0035BF4750